MLQDLFLKLETQAMGPVAEPLPYLCRMADNLLVDLRRSAAARSVREEAWMDTQFGSEMDDRPSAEQVLIGRQRLAMISSALAALPDRTIIAFRRFRIDAIPQKQIAAELGISVSAVEKHLQKAYQVVVDAQAKLDADCSRQLRS